MPESQIRFCLDGTGYVALSRESLVDTGEAIVAGLASTPAIDAYGHSIVHGAFSDSIAQRGLSGPRGVKFLLHHRSDQPAGKIRRLEYVEEGLFIEAAMNTRIGYVRDFYEAAVDNGGFSFSIGAYFENVRDVRNDRGDLLRRDVLKADLVEVSAVIFPANEEAQMLPPGYTLRPDVARAALPSMMVCAGLVDSVSDANLALKKLLAQNPKQEDKDTCSVSTAAISEIASLLRELRELG